MQTITLTRRSASAKLATWRDELNRMGVGSLLATPGTVLEYVGVGPEKDYDVIAFSRPEPYVGQGGTYSIGTDRYAVTVIAVSPSGHRVTVRDDRAIRIDDHGMSDSQFYRFEENPEGEVRTFNRCATGYRCGSRRLHLGKRSAFYDFCR